jgi:hypothetical protein
VGPGQQRLEPDATTDARKHPNPFPSSKFELNPVYFFSSGNNSWLSTRVLPSSNRIPKNPPAAQQQRNQISGNREGGRGSDLPRGAPKLGGAGLAGRAREWAGSVELTRVEGRRTADEDEDEGDDDTEEWRKRGWAHERNTRPPPPRARRGPRRAVPIFLDFFFPFSSRSAKNMQDFK